MIVARFEGVEFSYPPAEPGRGQPFALREVSFDLAEGEILGVLGPNSAGKTTLIRLLTRIVTPARGTIEVEGIRVDAMTRAELARRLAVVPQDVPQGLPFTVQELVLMGRYPHAPRRFFETPDDLAVARAAMAATGVLDLAGSRVGILSGGERQRVALARALAQEPRLLVLDEPTAHLDLRYQVECAELLRRVNRERGVTILLVSHDLNLAGELCDRVLLLADGRIARLGIPDDVLEETLLTTVYGCRVAVDRNALTGRPVVQVAWRR
jgi:ABC-type cobalamin/Fe3+-siderophores transport system ATPase subunit